MDTKLLRRWSARLSGVSALLFALGLGPIFATTGPYLAMGVWMYGGETEPNLPDLPFSWGFYGLGAVACAALLAMDFRDAERRFALYGTLGSLAMAGGELHYFYRLIQAARP